MRSEDTDGVHEYYRSRENRLAREVVENLLEAGFGTEYWLDPNGSLIRAAEGHRVYATTHILDKSEWLVNDNGDAVGVYASMSKRGWARVVIDHRDNVLFVDTYACSHTQIKSLKTVAYSRNYVIFDAMSNRTFYDPSEP